MENGKKMGVLEKGTMVRKGKLRGEGKERSGGLDFLPRPHKSIISPAIAWQQYFYFLYGKFWRSTS